jgi:MYXO-CTERM domain-containing protein
MLKKTFGMAAISAAALTASASADVTYTFENLVVNGGDAILLWEVGELTGTITAIQANWVMNTQSGGTWSSDLAGVLVAGNDIQNDQVLSQVGGFASTWGPLDHASWGQGNSSADGTPVNTTITLANAIDASTVSAWIGHGWNVPSSWGDWTGSITFIGASKAVPTPGALALLGLAGLVGVRRRRN